MELTVQFPLQPYPIQQDFATLLYQSLANGTKVCLVESPTGTGKSYSLLVGLASWLIDHRFQPTKGQSNTQVKLPSWIKKSNNDESKFIEAEKKRLEQRLKQIKSSKIAAHKIKPKIPLKKQQDTSSDEQSEQEAPKRQPKDLSVSEFTLPKMVFTSRTHSQLSQIMDSLKLLHTNLAGVAIASKKHLCINKAINSKPNPELECAKLLEKQGCPFYSKESYSQFLSSNVQESVNVGSKYSVCPYYSLKAVLDVGDVICVPYSSILNKDVREKIGIDIRNSIVVFDEGHNVIENELESRSVELSHAQIKTLLELVREYATKYNHLLKTKNRHHLSSLTKLLEDTLRVLQLKSSQECDSSESIPAFLLHLSFCQINIVKIKRYIEESNLNHKIYSPSKPISPYTLTRFIEFFSEIILHSDRDSKVLYKHGQNPQDTALKVMVFNTVMLDEVISLSRMTVFAGGTLSPLSSFEPLLTKFQHSCKQYSHIISQEQCKVYMLGRHRKKELSLIHATKSSPDTIEAIKDVLVKAKQVTSEGIVVFLQSYSFLEVVRGAISELPQFKDICVFDSQTNPKVFSLYEQRVNKGLPSMLFSVMGGKLSEGINFSDSLARLLLVFGLPYPDTRTAEMKLKIQFNGPQYTTNLCMKSVNQTIGRAIRHSKDWANIVLIDSRFLKLKDKLPSWMRSRVSTIEDIQEII